jgi:hypothetical protein
MKTIKQISFIGLTIIFVLNSCTMEKRVYTSGYHVAWKNGKHNSNKHELLHTENEKQIVRNQIVKVGQTVTATNSVEKTSARILIEDNITVSADKQQIIIPKKEKINLLLSNKVTTADEEKQTEPSFKSEFKKGTKMLLADGDAPKTNGLALSGFICSLVGLFLFGFILGVLALIFSAIGLGKINKDTSKWKGKGMAIAGIIIGIIDIVAWLIILALLL